MLRFDFHLWADNENRHMCGCTWEEGDVLRGNINTSDYGELEGWGCSFGNGEMWVDLGCALEIEQYL